jgi:tetratricopeptide (TPR) repeat protein
MSDDGPQLELERLVFEAQSLLERRRFDQARIVLAQGLRSHPHSVELMYLSGFLDYCIGNREEAIRGTAAVLALAPEHYGARRLRAHLMQDAHQYAEAELLWIGLLRAYPEDASCYEGYAQLNLQALDFDKAERLAAEGLRHEPDHAGCLYVLTISGIARGGFRDKGADAQTLARLLEKHPEALQTSIALIATLGDRGENRSALRIAQRLLRARPDSPELLELVKALARQSHWSMLPLYPMQRWGWGGAIAVTLGGILLVTQLGPRLPEGAGQALQYTWLGYVIYSWVWPPLLQRILR